MSPPILGRAQLLQILDRLPPKDWPAAAAAAGFDLRPSPPPRAPAAPPAPRPVETPSPGPAPEPVAAVPTDLPDLPFWRIVADRPLGAADGSVGAPAWLRETQAWDRLPESDPSLPIPAPARLAPRARQARFLRQHLATPAPGAALDLARLCQLLAERRVPPRLPRRARPVWPGQLRLLIDLAPPLTPFHADFWRWADQLRGTLGRRCDLLLARGGHPGELELADTGAAAHIALADRSPLIVLGDAGLYDAPNGPRYRHWRAFGQGCARVGLRPWLLAPCPPRCLRPEIAAWFHCVLLERGAPLRPTAQCRTVAEPSEPGLAQPGSSSDTGPLTDNPDRAADLFAALALGARTEPPLLRDLRLALTGRGSDIGWEYAVWNHPGVIADPLACALRPGYRATARRAFDALPGSVRSALQDARRRGNRHLSPLVRMEEALIAAAATEPGEGEGAEADARRLAATLHQGDREGLHQPLAAYIAGLGRRRPELLALHPGLALAWGLAHRGRLLDKDPPPLPPGLRLQQLAWLLVGAGAPRQVALGQVGDALSVFSAGGAGPLCPLSELETELDYWQAETLLEGRAPSAGPDLPVAGPLTLRLGEKLPLDPRVCYRLCVGRRQLDLETVRRPDWAEGLGRDRDGLFAELPDGRRVYWFPRGSMAVADGAKPEPAFDLPHGFWWDEAEYRAWFAAGRRLERPAWATRLGFDEHGWWAEFAVKDVVQAMRWIPPGEFLMGSPEDEPERIDEIDWAETQHPVVLTQGFWLADTACTQALWKSVLGEEPGHFKGAERPVEQVRWTDVTERFLPALNRLVPGLDAALPTEAQWEYACRAGTGTPFSFGPTLGTEQANYNGDYPYVGGAKGEYRGQTVEVKALPANAWGLYQMHGNVWEWCADWVAEYPRHAVVDPRGPPEGRERVVRGGSWYGVAGSCRLALRDGYDPGYRGDVFGFRLSRGSSPRHAVQGGSQGAAGVAADGGASAAAPAQPTRVPS